MNFFDFYVAMTVLKLVLLYPVAFGVYLVLICIALLLFICALRACFQVFE